MRVRLYLTSEWKIIDQPHQRVALIAGSTPATPDALLAWGPLVPGTTEDLVLLQTVMSIELGSGHLEVDPDEAKQTDDGWKYVERSARVRDGDQIVEERLAALFSFAEMRAVVIARSFNLERWAELRAVVRKAFAQATPDWRGDGEVACVSQLYEPVVD